MFEFEFEIAKRRAVSTPPTSEGIRQYTGSPGTAPIRHMDANPFLLVNVQGGVMKHRHKQIFPPTAPS